MLICAKPLVFCNSDICCWLLSDSIRLCQTRSRSGDPMMLTMRAASLASLCLGFACSRVAATSLVHIHTSRMFTLYLLTLHFVAVADGSESRGGVHDIRQTWHARPSCQRWSYTARLKLFKSTREIESPTSALQGPRTSKAWQLGQTCC